MISIKKTRSNGLSYEYSVNISADEVVKSMEVQIKKFGQNIKVAGFRNGQAPFDIIVKQYGESFLPYVVNDLIEESYQKITTQDGHNIAIVDSPNFGDITINKIISDGFSASLSFDVHPTIKEIKTEKIAVDYKMAIISDDMINEETDYLSKMFGTRNDVTDAEYIAKDGDIVDIAFSGYFTDTKKPVENAQAESYALELGSKSFISGFEEQVIGHKSGEKFTINTTFPSDYDNSSLAGKDVSFDIEIHKISSLTKANVDNELAKKLGFESLSLLIDNIKSRIDGSINKSLHKLILSAICNKCGEDVIISDKLLEKELVAIKKNNKDLPQDDELRVMVRQQMISNYIIAALAKQYGIEVSKEDIDNFLSQEAFRRGKPIEEIKTEYADNRKKFDQIYFVIQEEKVSNKLMSSVNKKVSNIPYKEFVAYIKDISSGKQKILVKI